MPLVLMLLIPLITLTAGATYLADRNVDGLRAERLSTSVNEVRYVVSEALARTADDLYGLRGLFESSGGNVTRATFSDYIHRSEYQARSPGAVAVGYIRIVPAADLATFVESVRAEGWPDFDVPPAGDRDPLYIVDHIVRVDGNTTPAGIELGSDPVLLEAMLRAIDTGSPVATSTPGPASVVGSEPRFLLMLPVYAGHPAIDTASRREAVVGLVASAHRASALAVALAASELPHDSDIEIYVGGGATLAPSALIFDSHPPAHAAARQRSGGLSMTQLSFYGATWTIAVAPSPGLLTTWERSTPAIVLLAGGVLSVALVTAVHFASASRERAEALAGKMIDRSQRDEQRFRMLLESAPDAMLIVDVDGRVNLVNEEALKLLGVERARILDRAIGEFFAYPTGEAGETATRRLLATGPGSGIDLIARRSLGGSTPVDVSINPLATEEGIVFVVSVRDATARKRRESEGELTRELTLAIGEATSFEGGLRVALKNVCTATRWTLGQAWVPNEDGTRLVCHPAWYVAGRGWRAFREHCEKETFAPGEGVIGTAWQTHEPIRRQHLREETSEHASLARAAGLASWVVVPVEAGPSVVAVLEFFSSEPANPDVQLSEPVRAVGPQLGALYLRSGAEEALRASEERFRGLLEMAPDAMIIVDVKGRIVLVNAQAERLFGYSREDILGNAIEFLIPSRFRDIHTHHREGFSEDPRVRDMGAGLDLYGLRSDGTEFQVEVSLGPLRTRSGLLVSAAVRDVTERNAVAMRLRRSLAEKESLLKEVHHRVKNNLQVISGLLALQSDHVPDARTREMLLESRDRVKSMALVHEKLYESSDLSRIELGSYVEELCHDMYRAHGGDGRRVVLRADVEPVHVDLDSAVACGLIMNELVSNAFKHAFPDGRAGTITVRVRERDGEVSLEVQDDGVGLEPISQENIESSMGLRLVTALVRQLGGALKMDGSNGASFRVTFARSGMEGH